MQLIPLAHGASGIFDEIILGAEGFLLIVLIIAFFRSRGRKPQPHAAVSPRPDGVHAAGDSVPAGESNPAEKNKQ